MDTFVDFVSRLVYGTGAEAVITPNHRNWLNSNPSPTGTQWLAHHVDAMLPAFETWLAAHNLPPIFPWNGVRAAPWDSSQDVPLGTDLDGSFTGIATLDQLGTALRNRFNTVSFTAGDLPDLLKAPFGYRYWGYIKWAKQMRDRFNGDIILPPTVIYDRDGTILSAIPFTDIFNELHWRWHMDPAGAGPTPTISTSAGQRAGEGGVGMTPGEEFIKFHRDHLMIFSEWLARMGQPAVRPIHMHGGWPPSGQEGNNPSTWTEHDHDPWINAEGGDTDLHLKAENSVDQIGNDVGGVHGSGHVGEIADIFYNNYAPRFFAWHGWIDSQWWWREPRFARWNTTTGLRERVFRPVLNTGSDWPGLHALTIVRDPAAPSDVISPANAVISPNLTTGAGTLRIKLFVKEPYGRNLTLKLKAEVFNDSVSTTVPTETIPESSHTYTLAAASGPGLDFLLDTEFTVDIAFATAFQSDDPTRANPAVGFINSRIRISGSLEVAGGLDPNFVHRDFVEIDLVKEKQAPQIEMFLDISSFSEDQVNSAMSGGEARFNGALIVAVQDRTSAPVAIAWPSAVANEVKGLLTGPVPASGLFNDTAHAPLVEIWQETVDVPFTGLTTELASGPLLEDPALADNLPQRFTYRYDVLFASGNDAFNGLATGAIRLARLRVSAADRSGNKALALGQLKLFRDANPFMRDDNPSWLSIDTRVIRLFQGQSKFGATLAAGNPTGFIQQVINNLNAGTTGGDTFDGLPTNQEQSALEYSTAITNPSTGASTPVYNFALAKVRLQGAAGAANVRAFFRLFRYTATNLIFNPGTSYRFFDDGVGRKVPLLGFTSAALGGTVTSIPFFAEPRVPFGTAMTIQTDAPNVKTFSPGPTTERVMYFGAYLDINQTGARLPTNWIVAHPDGGFAAGEVQSLRNLMTDAHQCMVVEIKYDGDLTQVGDTPASSDNLAQRNLLILTTDNPGGNLTHTVEHSFEVHLGDRDTQKEAVERTMEMHWPQHDEGQHHGGNDREPYPAGDDGFPETPPVMWNELDRVPFRFISSEQRERLARGEAMQLAFLNPDARDWKERRNFRKFLPEARRRIDQKFPFVFDAARWQRTSTLFDELMFVWNNLPKESRVELYLPRTNCEHIINLRNLRHAPSDVQIVDSHTLLLVPDGITYVPLPPASERRIAGVVTVALPDGIKRGQEWKVDVLQVRGGEQRITGAFQIDIQVSNARAIADPERRLLEIMFERLSLMPKHNHWHPVLARRVATLRERARALADSAGIPWKDPTLWTDPQDPSRQQPFDGQKIRVVLEKIQILEDHDPWIKGPGEIRFVARVRTNNNGGIEQRTLLPASGVYKISDTPGENVKEINQVIFEGYVADDLAIEIVGLEEDTFDPDDDLGKYTRLFRCAGDEWFRSYEPGDEPIDPEEVGSWRAWYRIERG